MSPSTQQTESCTWAYLYNHGPHRLLSKAYARPGPFPTNTGADGLYETLLSGLAAERDRYELLLEINYAVVTQPGWETLSRYLRLSTQSHSYDAALISLYDPQIRRLRLKSFDLQYASDLEEVHCSVGRLSSGSVKSHETAFAGKLGTNAKQFSDHAAR